MKDKHLYVRKASAGSGKTYTLAAHYVALLLHGESYRSILAVTFTNKATAEMKERILIYLYQIARETQLPSTQGFLARVRAISKELGYRKPEVNDDGYCADKAEELFNAILSDYDSMRVSTIDAFLQSLLAGMVQMLGGAVGYQVELDTDGVISDAVDRLLTEGAQDKEVRRRITRYMESRMADDKGWDIRGGLRQIAKELYRELLQEKEGQLVMNETALKEFRERVEWQKNAPVEELKEVLAKVADCKAKERIAGSLAGEKIETKDLFRGYTDKQLEKIKPDSPEMRMHVLADKCRKAMLHERFCTEHLNDLVLMDELKREIETALNESNTRLLSVTANTLAKALRPGDADFVLEKTGIRYRHIMLDEFQDTSALQWENFRKILQEILSTTSGSTLIVGDIKQSIYRWRNGDWEIMAGLEKEWEGYYNRDVKPLVCNFRSEKEVVQFNLDTMAALSAQEPTAIGDLYQEGYTGANIGDYHRKDHRGGYVQFKSWYPTAAKGEERQANRHEMMRDMLETIVRLHGEEGEKYSDMMILLRKNKEAAEIMQVMHEMELQLPVVSGDCFELGSSRSVQTLVAGMRYLYQRDDISREYLRIVRPDIDPRVLLSARYRMLSLSDLTESLTRLYLSDEKGLFTGHDLAYVNCFKDKVRQYVATTGSDGKAFLNYWDDKLHKVAVPASDTEGIRMMTIHASKGLEAKNVFIPFCDWKMEEDKSDSRLWCEVEELHTEDGQRAIMPIPQGKFTAEAGFEAPYEREHLLQRVDNLNLLYVAFTRAAERLYIWSDVTEYKGKNAKSIGEMDIAQRLHALYGDLYMRGEEGQRTKDEGQGTKDEGQGTKDKGQRTKDEGQRSKDPFSFAEAEVVQAEAYSSEEHVDFQQSQDSRKYGWNIASMELESDDMSQRVLGTICHEILATLGLYPDRDSAVDAARKAVEEAYHRGVIKTEALRRRIEPLIVDTVGAAEMVGWFTGDWRVLREEAVVFTDEHGEVEERRMDRVMWRGTEAVVLDYKFGHDDPKYDRQVCHYMNICRRMGATSVRGYLWIAAERKRVEV